ncbi:MAG TPA: DsbA family protein, partial [Burkholderiaceae bacterium]|nr:DsbA family protein [Burkholderiaceae bacterium]
AVMIGVPLNAPAFHPFNPLLALRVSSLPVQAAQKWKLVDALFAAVWVRGMHITNSTVVEQVANKAGLDGTALVAQASQSECKAQLRMQTDQAIADGVFGVPTMAVDDELFWGYDDFAFLQSFLDGADPVDAMNWSNAAGSLRSSATRGKTS